MRIIGINVKDLERNGTEYKIKYQRILSETNKSPFYEPKEGGRVG